PSVGDHARPGRRLPDLRLARCRLPPPVRAAPGDARPAARVGPAWERVRRRRSRLPRLPRVGREVDPARVAALHRLDDAPRERPGSSARASRHHERDRTEAELLQAAPGVCVSASRIDCRPGCGPPAARLMADQISSTTLVLGGGPAGLTAGYLLCRSGRDVVVFEAEDQVGGVAQTVERHGYRFAPGGPGLLGGPGGVGGPGRGSRGGGSRRRRRLAGICGTRRYLDYPLRGPDVVRKLGPVELARCMSSYLRAAARRDKHEESLE